MARIYKHECQWCGYEYDYCKYDDVIECPRCEAVEEWKGWVIVKKGLSEEGVEAKLISCKLKGETVETGNSLPFWRFLCQSMLRE